MFPEVLGPSPPEAAMLSFPCAVSLCAQQADSHFSQAGVKYKYHIQNTICWWEGTHFPRTQFISAKQFPSCFVEKCIGELSIRLWQMLKLLAAKRNPPCTDASISSSCC